MRREYQCRIHDMGQSGKQPPRKTAEKYHDKSNKMEWHPAFVEAIQLELYDYKDSLEILSEKSLTSKPLQIDCVIIKKTKNTVIKKNIGKIFRKINLLEYKSPLDYIAVKDFYKVYCYMCLYIYLNNCPITDVTITFAGNRYPRELLQHLRKVRGYTVDEFSPGIYNILGDAVPIQVINRRRLSAKENLWLKSLSNELDYETIEQVSRKARNLAKRMNVEALWDVIIRANVQILKEAAEMGKRTPTLEEVFVKIGLAAEAESKGEARGRKSEALDIAKNMANHGLPMETIAAVTKLKPEIVKKLYK